MHSIAKAAFLLVLIASMAGGAFVWLVPVEVAQNWALEAAPDDPLARFEAVGRREAVWWSLRVALPVLAALAVWGLARTHSVACRVPLFAGGLAEATAVRHGRFPRLASLVLRLFAVGWVLLAVTHLSAAVWQRIEDWPVYRLRSGAEILPNISQSNRDVIRYVRAATPPDAKILVLSDQKLFFLAYYLRPRQVFHPTHPGSEFVIPLPHGERPLPAYVLDDISPEYIGEIAPDYILEWYEGRAYAEPERFDEDPAWLAFQRDRYGADFRPDILVRLQKVGEGRTP